MFRTGGANVASTAVAGGGEEGQLYDLDLDPEDVMALMEGGYAQEQEKLVDDDFFNAFADDFDDDDLE